MYVYFFNYVYYISSTDVDECASAPCQNGGTCIDQVNGYLCHCEPGFTDLQCQKGMNKCMSILRKSISSL